MEIKTQYGQLLQLFCRSRLVPSFTSSMMTEFCNTLNCSLFKIDISCIVVLTSYPFLNEC